ncbi:hypothetical protein TRFO_39833 [Tritrichomonas foetus]|uniref:Tim44-like domain-containing protein n=1 Tax=Tritrichomonas foetus TaxID=1144522 RepID=A0A1J4J5T1_9EUKA|nr:hypothetical protein TRFO_39833 [Tritrichomonas foetus]|eukprot:OHS94009.1 hypothetical protein TRFO_39833 [Tritrichomonas foetus]
MTLVQNTPHALGSRNMSMFEAFNSSIGQNLHDDPDVQTWMTAIKNDPIVKTTSKVAQLTNSALMLTLSSADRIANAALLPITYPLSKIYPKFEHTLTNCPFPPSPPVTISGRGDLQVRKNNFIEKLQLTCKNVSNSLESSRSFLIRNGFKLTKFLLTVPFKIRFSDTSKENLVLTAIDRYFPSFNAPDFCTWMEESFLPVVLSYYISGKTNKMKELADTGIVQERQVQIASVIMAGHIIKSRLLDVSNVSILDYDFKNSLPILSVKCNVDYIENIVDKNGENVVGAPDNIKRSEVLIQMLLNTDGDVPKWKAYEIRIASANDRI